MFGLLDYVDDERVFSVWEDSNKEYDDTLYKSVFCEELDEDEEYIPDGDLPF